MMNRGRHPARLSRALWILLLIGLVGLRLVDLDADPPGALWTESFGPWVDEGYKTLSARNLLLFGETQWNEHDDYRGWLARSPVTQWGFLLAFKLLGEELMNARLVTVLWFLALLVVYLWGVKDTMPPWLALLGLALLGTNLTLFAFSRLAIFEIPMAFFVLLSLMILRRVSPTRPTISLVLVLLCLVVSALGIKASALVYFMPALAGVGLYFLLRHPKLSHSLGIIVTTAVVVGGLLVFFQDAWIPRVDLTFDRVVREVFASPPAWAHPLLIGATFLAVGGQVSRNGGRLLATPYAAALFALCVGGPLFLSLMRYNPLRYYVPLLPAFILLVLECLDSGHGRQEAEDANDVLSRLGSTALLLLSLVAMTLAVNRLLLGWILPERHPMPSYVAPLRFTEVFLIAAFGTLVITIGPVWRWVFQNRVTAAIVLSLLLASLTANCLSTSRAVLSPQMERARISSEVERIVAPGASVGGDWAPLFAIGTELRSLYMNQVFNPPERVHIVRPDYLLWSDTHGMRNYLRVLEADPLVEAHPAIYESEYKQRRIALYPLTYPDGHEGRSEEADEP